MSIFFLTLCHGAYAIPIPIGTPNEGKLIDAMAIPDSGEGYIHMFREHERFWGTSEIITMIEKAAADISNKYPGRDRLQVEDISAEHGGDIDNHSSHENGLDVDLQYLKADNVEHDPIRTKQKFAPPMVVKGKVSPNFDHERNWELVKALHRHGDVQKIFMDTVLKNELCKYVKKTGDFKKHVHVLQSLRHVANHQDHLHVRLRCPKDAKKCVNQAEPPTGSGCS